MAEKKGITELSEFNAMILVLAIAMKKIGADKKVNLADVPEVIELAKKADVIKAGIENIQEVPKEVKDLDAEEAKILLQQYLDLIHAIKTA